MASAPRKRRFVVSDLGFAFAVHDTHARQEYEFPAGRGKPHKSSNELNTRRVQLFPTLAEAVRAALELNRKDEEGTLGG